MNIYLDNNATTKVDKEVLKAMIPFFSEHYGNASSLHLFGKEAGKALTYARDTIASLLNINSDELIFTGSGSEADNLAIRGIARTYKHRGKHIITSSIEHPAVKNTFQDLIEDGFDISVIPVDENGVLILDVLEKSIRNDTILVSIMHANNEVGTFQPIEDIAKLTKKNKLIFHVDAVQTMGKVPIYPYDIGIDLLSFAGHKFYGPKGVGALYVRRGVRLGKVLTGGNQENRRRPGTSNVALIVAMAKALEISYENMNEEWERISKLRDYFEDEILKELPEIIINGKNAKRLSGTSNIIFKYLDSESISISLNARGIATSASSACSSDDLKTSHVLLAMGISEEDARGAIRFSLGKYNTKDEIDYTIIELINIIDRLRNQSPQWNALNPF